MEFNPSMLLRSHERSPRPPATSRILYALSDDDGSGDDDDDDEDFKSGNVEMRNSR